MLEQSHVEDLIRLAQAEAAKAIAEGNPPFGAVLDTRPLTHAQWLTVIGLSTTPVVLDMAARQIRSAIRAK